MGVRGRAAYHRVASPRVSARPHSDVVSEGAAAARGGALRAGGFLAGQLLTVGAVALLFRHLGVDDTGRYVTVLSLVAIVQGLTDLGLTTLGVRELATTPQDGRRALLADLLGLRLAATVAGVALVVAFAAAVGFGWTVVAGTALAGLGLVVQNAATTLGMDLLVRLQAGRMALGDLVRQATAAVLIVAGVAIGADLIVFFAILIPAALAGFAVVVAFAARVGPAREPRRWTVLLRQTIPFAIAAAASVLFFRVAVVEMSLLAGDRETGLFGASFRVVEVLSAIPPLAVSAIFPVLSRRAAQVDAPDASLHAAVTRTTQACAAAGGALALGLALGAPAVIQVIAGSAFDDAIGVLRIQGLALAASFVAAPWGFALLSLGRERTLMWLNVVGVLVALAVGAALIAADGARGGAIATVLGEAGLAIGFAVALSRARPDLRPDLRGLAKVVVAAAIGATAYALPLPAIPVALIGLVAYGLVLAVLRGLPHPRALLRG
jgi:O-antigen/teichoic acid export membrane protein